MHTTRNYRLVLWILWPRDPSFAFTEWLKDAKYSMSDPHVICCNKKYLLRGSPAGHFLYWPYDIEGAALVFVSLGAAVYSVAVMSSVTMSKSLQQTSFVNYLWRENGSLSVICLSVIEDTTLHHNCAFRFLFITIHSSLITMCWVISYFMVVKCWHILIEFR